MALLEIHVNIGPLSDTMLWPDLSCDGSGPGQQPQLVQLLVSGQRAAGAADQGQDGLLPGPRPPRGTTQSGTRSTLRQTSYFLIFIICSQINGLAILGQT